MFLLGYVDDAGQCLTIGTGAQAEVDPEVPAFATEGRQYQFQFCGLQLQIQSAFQGLADFFVLGQRQVGVFIQQLGGIAGLHHAYRGLVKAERADIPFMVDKVADIQQAVADTGFIEQGFVALLTFFDGLAGVNRLGNVAQ